MLELLKELFALPFIHRALIVGILVSLCAALLGINLVLKRYSMIGDGLSHVAFGALAIALALNLAPLWVSIPVVVIAAFFLLRISGNSRIKGDAAIAIIASSSLAIGVIVLSLAGGMNADIHQYLFGSVLALSREDVYLSLGLSIMVLGLYLVFYQQLFTVAFDEDFARATGVQVGLFQMLSAFLTAITIVVGMRIMGALLISSLIIFPALTAMRICSSYKGVVMLAGAVSVTCFVLGMTASLAFAIPAGASIVVMNLLFFCLFALAGGILKRA